MKTWKLEAGNFALLTYIDLGNGKYAQRQFIYGVAGGGRPK